jgi:hypothetical protein
LVKDNAHGRHHYSTSDKATRLRYGLPDNVANTAVAVHAGTSNRIQLYGKELHGAFTHRVEPISLSLKDVSLTMCID